MKIRKCYAVAAPVVYASIACAAIIAITLAMELREEKRWEKFKTVHQCRVVSRIDGQTVVGSTTGGNAVLGSTSPQSGWLCDNGITYFKAD